MSFHGRAPDGAQAVPRVRSGRDVTVYVADSLMSAGTAASITRALWAAGVGR
jgi:hypothetical protein